jgi:hypothetical protein
MRERVRSSKIVGVAGAVAAIWLFCAGPAWAGGASDAGTLLSLLCNTFAFDLGISCPQYPAYANTTTTPTTAISSSTPIAVELAAWENISPDDIRMLDSECIQFGPAQGTAAGDVYCPTLAVNATNGPVTPQASNDQNDQNQGNANSPVALSFLQPLAFISNPSSTTAPLTVTQNSDPTANAHVRAAVLRDKTGQPKTLDIFYDYVAASSPGQVKVSFPLAVLVKGAATETSVVATLTATCSSGGSCSNVKVSANLPGTTTTSFSPSDLGLSFTYSVGPSPNGSLAQIAELRVPLLVNPQTDPVYFPISGFPSLPQCANGSNPISGYCNAFSATPPNGFAPTFLTNTSVGMAPSAAPQCPGNQPGLPSPPGTLCPMQSDPTKANIPPTFGFCASFSGKSAAAFFLAVGTEGSVITSSPVAPSPLGAPYPACPS